MAQAKKPLPARLFSHMKIAESGCWEWIGFKNKKGYGLIHVSKGKNELAYRVSYKLLKGAIADDLELDHLCRNPSCINPDHLEAVTHTINMRRGIGGWNNRIKTHCPQGHPYDETNTLRFNNQRHCKMCSIIYIKRWHTKKQMEMKHCTKQKLKQ